MVLIKITMNAIPEKRLEILQTLLPMIEPTTKKAGCLSFGVFCGIDDQNRFNLIGEWETREDLDRQIASRQFSVLLGTKGLLSEPPDIQILTVSRSEGMDAVDSIRDRRK